MAFLIVIVAWCAVSFALAPVLGRVISGRFVRGGVTSAPTDSDRPDGESR